MDSIFYLCTTPKITMIDGLPYKMTPIPLYIIVFVFSVISVTGENVKFFPNLSAVSISI